LLKYEKDFKIYCLIIWGGVIMELNIIVDKVMHHCEYNDKEFLILSKKATIDDAINNFSDVANNNYLQAIIITENAKPNENPLTIITRFDLPKMYDLVKI